MNYNLKIFLFLLFTVLTTYGQNRKEPFRNPKEKIEQLEKIKLLEELQLDEEKTLKFFARRNQHDSQIDSIRNSNMQNFRELDEVLSENRKEVDKIRVELIIARLIDNEEEMLRLRRDFINSLDDILTIEQKAKYILFERRFRDEIRELLMKRNKR